MTLRLAMWSGPRNISTALMRSFESRPDTQVVDEPLYAPYLASTGLPHPMAAEIQRVHEQDWRKVAAELTGPLRNGHTVYYQKHMAHHLLPEMERDWLDRLENAFLIREPRAMLTSLLEKLSPVRLEDTGLPQQVELFDWQRERTGRIPAVVDSKDLLLDPPAVLAQLCERVGLSFDPAMLSWEPGPRASDGCWAPHWYGSVFETTAFSPYRSKDALVPTEYEALASECEALYARLHAHRIQA